MRIIDCVVIFMSWALLGFIAGWRWRVQSVVNCRIGRLTMVGIGGLVCIGMDTPLLLGNVICRS